MAGNGGFGFSGDGGPATAAKLLSPNDVAVDGEGNVYIADTGNNRIRRVTPEGTIVTIAGTGDTWFAGFNGDGGPAVNALMCSPVGVTFDSGNIYTTTARCHRVRKITPDGIIRSVAGRLGSGGDAELEDGGPARGAWLETPYDVVLDTEGNLYIVDGGGGQCRVRKVTTDGVISTFAGTGVCHNAQLGESASDSPLYFPQGLAIDPMGALFVASTAENRIVKIDFPFQGFENDDIAIPSADGSEVYQFDPTGRHLSTADARTGAILQSFAYDPEGLLASITDGDGDVTRIERDLGGAPTAIVSPFGPRTTLTLHPDGMLKALTNPEGETTQMTYRAGGLLETLTDPRSHTTTFDYTPLGRLERDSDDLGGFKSLSRTDTEDSYTVRLETALSQVRTYQVQNLANGDRRRVITDPSGLATELLVGTDGTREIRVPDGTVTTESEGPDPRFGMQAPLVESLTVTTPEGRSSVVTTTRTATLANPNNLLSLLTETETVKVNGRTYTAAYETATRTATATTPEGRVAAATTDDRGRVTRTAITGVTPTDFGYDTQGRLQTVVQGVRDYTLSYRPDGFLETITDPLSRVVRFDYDSAGRVTRQTFADGRAIGYGYDDNGNLTAITPPGRPGHLFDYNAVNLEEFYNPPDIGLPEDRTRYDYNLDRQIDLITRPDGGVIDFAYDSAGRLDTITTGRGVIDYDYDPVTGNLSTLTAPDETLTYTYDGSLLKATTWSGEVSGNVTRTYDNDFRVISRSVNGGDTISFGYNDDSLLTSAGALSLVRDPGNGFLDTTTLDIITTDTDYNSFGEVESFEVKASGSTVYKVDPFTRDDLGRIRFKTETIGGVTQTFEYQYDLGGRLDKVFRDAVEISDYDYNDNGNRTAATNLSGIPDYDDQDRLRTYGDNSYTYTDNGELLIKTGSDGATTHGYDAFGNLVAVNLPNGTAIEYVVDGDNRRVGKKMNGVLTQGFLYKDQLNPIVELDGSGNVVSRFVYGEAVNAPAYMIRGGIAYRIISDHLGSPRLVINSSDGSIVQRMDYDEFGNVTLDTNPGFQPFGFAGGLYDQQTKLVRFGARDYDAETGRWTAKDPILFGGSDTNLYGYVLNDPVNFHDENGKNPIGIGIILMGGIVGGILTPSPLEQTQTPVDEAINLLEGVSTGAAVAGLSKQCVVTGGAALFGRGGLLNSNRFLRIGVSRKGGREVFRITGDLLNGRKIDVFDLGPL